MRLADTYIMALALKEVKQFIPVRFYRCKSDYSVVSYVPNSIHSVFLQKSWPLYPEIEMLLQQCKVDSESGAIQFNLVSSFLD